MAWATANGGCPGQRLPGAAGLDNEAMSTAALPPVAEPDILEPSQRRLLEAGKREHKQTTEATQRALKAAEQTVDIARNTLVEVHRQGEVLSSADQGVQAMEKDVQEASRILRFMKRFCCFQVICCCDCFDPDSDMERTRRRRVQARDQEMKQEADHRVSRHAVKSQAVERLARKGDAAFNGNEDAARAELLLTSHQVKAKKHAQQTSLGYGLPDEDNAVLQQETVRQDVVLDRIGTAVETLRIMSVELNNELQVQAPEIDALVERTHVAEDNLGNLSKAARKI